MKINFLIFLIVFLSIQLSAQPRREMVQVIVAPDQANWTYETGDRAEFSISVLKNNVPLEGIEIKYSWGFNDNVCPPTSMHAAHNVITGEKELLIFQETQHWTFPEQHELKNAWLFEKLK